MKTLLLLSTLVTSSLAGLLIPRSKYLQHVLMKNGGRDGKQCDDYCDKEQKLKHGFKIKFFGETHDEFWPCSNGLISFKGEVETCTPIKFPNTDHPVVAVFWGDVDLRACRSELGMRCSYFKLFYGEEAGFLNSKITHQYMTWPQTFKAKVIIVQIWDRVP